VTSKTQRKAQWISQDGTPKPDLPQEVEEVEVDHQAAGEVVGAGHQVIEEEAVRVVLLNVLVNLGESSLSARDDYEGFMYIVNDLSLYLTLSHFNGHFTRALSGSDNKVRPVKRALNHIKLTRQGVVGSARLSFKLPLKCSGAFGMYPFIRYSSGVSLMEGIPLYVHSNVYALLPFARITIRRPYDWIPP
jgi:hypothetical protein